MAGGSAGAIVTFIDDTGKTVRVSAENPLPTGAGGPTSGAADDAAYSDATGAADGSMIALLKGIYVQLAEINAKTPEPA